MFAVNEWMNERTNERTNERNGRTDGRTVGQAGLDGWTKESMNQWLNQQNSESMISSHTQDTIMTEDRINTIVRINIFYRYYELQADQDNITKVLNGKLLLLALKRSREICELETRF